MAAFRVLSLDGGGIMGAFTASVLEAYENELEGTGTTLVDHFDLITGTSTGGLIALALGMGHSAREIRDFYRAKGPALFPYSRGVKRWLKGAVSLFRPKLSNVAFRDAILPIIGEAPLRTALTSLVIPTYDAQAGGIYLLKTPHNRERAQHAGLRAIDVALATTAAPTYLPAHTIQDRGVFIDGGVWANCPALVGIVEAVSFCGQRLEDVRVLSISTTNYPFRIDQKQLRGGLFSWAVKIVETFMFAQGQNAVAAATCLLRDRFHRIDCNAVPGAFTMDDVRAVDELISTGRKEAEKFGNRSVVKNLFLYGPRNEPRYSSANPDLSLPIAKARPAAAPPPNETMPASTRAQTAFTPVDLSRRPSTYRQRLVVYVVWRPEFADGAKIASGLYDHLMRDSQEPIARGLGIPVYFRYAPAGDGSEAPIDIPIDEAEHTAVVVLVDDTMFSHRDDGWAAYVGKLHEEIRPHPEKHRLLPVKFSDRGFDLAPDVGASNFIRPADDIPAASWAGTMLASGTHPLFNAVTHELCRLLLNEPRIDHAREDYGGRVGEPVTIFISHAKDDGARIAENIRDHINRNLQLKTFFDANDIPFGSEFALILRSSVDREHTAVLVIQTDRYSTREWCQREVLWAKKYERPVLIAHAVTRGEKCSFPYLGNAPTIRFDPKAGPEVDYILGQMLVEVLRNVHFRQHFEDLRALFGLGREVKALPQTPELLTLLELRSDPNNWAITTVVYQEPSLGDHLLDVLRRFVPTLTVTTPVDLLASGPSRASGVRPLTGKMIGISISESPDLARLGFHSPERPGDRSVHQEDVMVELARYLLKAGASLAYGGDLRPGGFTEILRDLAWTYDASDSTEERLRGYLAWPIHKDRLRYDPSFQEWMDPKNRIRFEFVARPEDQAGVDAKPPTDRSPENLLAWARSLTAMREKMDTEVHARVLIGGRVEKYMGRYPGLAEEALMAMRSGKPLYLAGGLGGCTRALIDAIEGRIPEVFTEAFQYRDDDYKQMVGRLGQPRDTRGVDYPGLLHEFTDWGIAGLSRSNGLTPEENRRLFVTPHVIEIVYLILKGLFNAFGARTR
jgi:patatin-like phospholipase/acyl hydrolase